MTTNITAQHRTHYTIDAKMKALAGIPEGKVRDRAIQERKKEIVRRTGRHLLFLAATQCTPTYGEDGFIAATPEIFIKAMSGYARFTTGTDPRLREAIEQALSAGGIEYDAMPFESIRVEYFLMARACDSLRDAGFDVVIADNITWHNSLESALRADLKRARLVDQLRRRNPQRRTSALENDGRIWVHDSSTVAQLNHLRDDCVDAEVANRNREIRERIAMCGPGQALGLASQRSLNSGDIEQPVPVAATSIVDGEVHIRAVAGQDEDATLAQLKKFFSGRGFTAEADVLRAKANDDTLFMIFDILLDTHGFDVIHEGPAKKV